METHESINCLITPSLSFFLPLSPTVSIPFDSSNIFYFAIPLIYAACIKMNGGMEKWHQMVEVLVCIYCFFVCVCVANCGYICVFFSPHILFLVVCFYFIFFIFSTIWQAHICWLFDQKEEEKIGCGYLHTTTMCEFIKRIHRFASIP